MNKFARVADQTTLRKSLTDCGFATIVKNNMEVDDEQI